MAGDANTNGFFDVSLSDIFGTGLKVYEDKHPRIGSGGTQPQTPPNAPAPAPAVAAPTSSGMLGLPTWSVVLLAVSGALLVGALALRAMK